MAHEKKKKSTGKEEEKHRERRKAHGKKKKSTWKEEEKHMERRRQELRTWCCVSAARVAPPATPTIAFITLAMQTRKTNIEGNRAETSSMPMARSFRMSATRRHCLQFESKSVPFFHAKRIRPTMLHPSRKRWVIVAAVAVAVASPTPTP